jgi:hypothetical protein
MSCLGSRHGKLPATIGGETLLPLGCVRRRHYKSRAIAQVLEHTIEAIGPHRAMRASGAHVVDDEKRVLVAEQSRQPRLSLRGRKFIVLNFLGLDRCLSASHFRTNLGDLAPVFDELLGGFIVLHR